MPPEQGAQGRSPTVRWAGASSSSLKAVQLPGPRAPWPLALIDHRTTHPGGGTPIPQERGVREPSGTPAQASSGGQGSGGRETDTETAQGERERGRRLHGPVKTCILTPTIRASGRRFQW